MYSTRNYYNRVPCDTPIIYRVVKVNTTPITEPVTLPQMKEWLRVDFEIDDTIITDLITASRAGVEQYCNISIVEKTITVTADWNGEWELPYAPVKSVTSVQSNTGGDYTAETGYKMDGDLLQFTGRVKIAYVAGMDEIPADLIADIKRVVAYLYEHRGDEPLSSLQGGQERKGGIDQAMELFCKKHRKIWA